MGARTNEICDSDATGTQGSGIPAGIGADSEKIRLLTGIPGIRDCRRLFRSGGYSGGSRYSENKT